MVDYAIVEWMDHAIVEWIILFSAITNYDIMTSLIIDYIKNCVKNLFMIGWTCYFYNCS
jgi:hypothetical protein